MEKSLVMNQFKYILILCLSIFQWLQAQTIFEHNYYASNLNSFQFYNPELSDWIYIPSDWRDQQIHFRWNGHIYHEDHLSAHISVRNRLFSGYQWEENLFNFRDGLETSSLQFSSLQEKKNWDSSSNRPIIRTMGKWKMENPIWKTKNKLGNSKLLELS